jgi:hypothetical protein
MPLSLNQHSLSPVILVADLQTSTDSLWPVILVVDHRTGTVDPRCTFRTPDPVRFVPDPIVVISCPVPPTPAAFAVDHQAYCELGRHHDDDPYWNTELVLFSWS